MEKIFSQSELESIAKALGDTSDGLTNSEIENILKSIKIPDPSPGITKWMRIFNALAERQNYSKNRRATLEFIRRAMKPERYIKNQERFEILRANLNLSLSFTGITIDESGALNEVERAKTISEAKLRADNLRADMSRRGVHVDVLRFCRAELVVDNYFHAVQEATKSIFDKIRTKTGVHDDGAKLIDATLCGKQPLLAINQLVTESHYSEQSGFANLVKGVFGMFRNPTAHEAKILWNMSKEDAEDLLSLASFIHRRLDNARYTR